MQTIILAFGFSARQGKDSAAQAIVEERGKQFDIRQYPFAKALKEEFYSACQNPLDPFWEHLFTNTGKVFRYFDSIGDTGSLANNKVVFIPKPSMDTPTWEDIRDYCEKHKNALRWVLQYYGTEYRRNGDPFYWIRKTGEAINQDSPQFALIPDLRFINEAFFVKANDGYTIKVERCGFDDVARTGHMSESQLANFQFDVSISVLDGELRQLKKDAVTLFDMIVEWERVPEYTTSDFTEESMGENSLNECTTKGLGIENEQLEA